MSIRLQIHYEIEQTRARISHIQNLQNGELLSFGTDGNLSLADYFGPGGKGNDCTVSIQTVEGRFDIPVAGNTVVLTDDTITLSVPSSGRGILNNIDEGDRFIFAIHRPAKDK